MTATIIAITSNRWIMLPAIWKLNPSSQSTNRIANMVHNIVKSPKPEGSRSYHVEKVF
jgi:hypothetical protein